MILVVSILELGAHRLSKHFSSVQRLSEFPSVGNSTASFTACFGRKCLPTSLWRRARTAGHFEALLAPVLMPQARVPKPEWVVARWSSGSKRCRRPKSAARARSAASCARTRGWPARASAAWPSTATRPAATRAPPTRALTPSTYAQQSPFG